MSKEAMKLALEVMRNQGDVSVDEWIAAEKALREALAEQPAPYMAVSNDRMSVDPHTGNVSIGSPPQRKPLTDEQVNLFINGRGDEDDDDYVEPTGDGFGLTDADLVRLVRRVEAAHGIKEKNT